MRKSLRLPDVPSPRTRALSLHLPWELTGTGNYPRFFLDESKIIKAILHRAAVRVAFIRQDPWETWEGYRIDRDAGRNGLVSEVLRRYGGPLRAGGKDYQGTRCHRPAGIRLFLARRGSDGANYRSKPKRRPANVDRSAVEDFRPPAPYSSMLRTARPAGNGMSTS